MVFVKSRREKNWNKTPQDTNAKHFILNTHEKEQ